MTGGPPTPNSASPSTPTRYPTGPSTPTRYSAGPSTPSGECSNCKLLSNELMVLKTTLEMYRHPERHTDASAVLLEQLYDNLGKLRM